jgi:ABC-type branched-subunit amino acid transport system substrate-binding protein
MRLTRTLAFAVVVVALTATSLTPAGAQAKPKAADVGITDAEIRIAVVADVDNSLVPGLFQSAVDAVNAWAKVVNKQGGVAGRKVVVDFLDSKLNPNEARNAVIKACSQDFALVGTDALLLANVDDMVQCKDAAGNAIGIPDLAATATNTVERCSPVTFLVSGQDAQFCATKDEHPQTYTVQQGDYRYYLSKNKDLHGIWLAPSDVAAVRNAALPSYQAGVDLGIKKDGQGFYDVTARSQQSALTPYVQVLKQDNSTFTYNGSSADLMTLMRREATIQGVNSVKVWACHEGCYDATWLKNGGADVEGTNSVLNALPWYTEYKLNPSLRALVKQIGGAEKLNSYGMNAWVSALLFQDAAGKAVANGGSLSRQSLLEALKNEHKFTAQGIVGPTDVGNRVPPPCIVVAQVKNGKWVRAYPSKAGTFNCDKKNLAVLKMDPATT